MKPLSVPKALKWKHKGLKPDSKLGLNCFIILVIFTLFF